MMLFVSGSTTLYCVGHIVLHVLFTVIHLAHHNYLTTQLMPVISAFKIVRVALNYVLMIARYCGESIRRIMCVRSLYRDTTFMYILNG